MNQLGRLQVGIDCDNCGITKGNPVGENLNRCVECGRYASDDTSHLCCVRHEVRNSPYPSGQCPRCEQEQSVRAQEQEMMERRANPRMHNSVDAPRW
jgi:hypothetical protein